MSSEWPPRFRLSNQNFCVHFLCPPCTLHAPPLFIRIIVWWTVHAM
jgi:hypothetical protein